MEFWSVEVKAGAPLKVEAGATSVLHLSQASLGEVKKDKGNESIPLFLNINGQKLVIGTLSPEKIPQISYDLVMDRDFELSHNWKNGSIYFCGYRSLLDQSDDENTDSDSDIGMELPIITKENGKPEPKNEKSNLTTEKTNAGKPKVKVVEPNKDDDDKDSDDDSDEDDESESEEGPMDISEEDSSDEDDEDSDEEDGSSDEDDEKTPKKAEQGKKRPAESGTKTPVPEKKTKLVTPEKTGPDGKKGSVHVATPHPSKKAGKTPANNDKSKQQTPNNDKSKQQTPKSAGQVACKSCTKTFNSDGALQSHTKAKHSDGK